MTEIVPYLVVRDVAEALEFYTRASGFEEHRDRPAAASTLRCAWTAGP